MPVREMTLGEKNRFAGWFPSMNVEVQPRVTGEATRTYNCIAWTLGITNRWINPKHSLQAWDNFYALNQYIRADAGEIAIWKTPAAFTHGCVANAAQGFNWESKCGPNLRILHQLPEMVGDTYGNVYAYYTRMTDLVCTAPRGFITEKPTSLMDDQQKALKIKNAVSNIPAALREAFLTQFEAWKATWFVGDMALSSDTRDRADTYSYRILLAMGPEIIPLVVEQLADPENFMATQLYDDLQSDPKLQLNLAAADPAHLEGEQGRAKRIVENYLTTTQS